MRLFVAVYPPAAAVEHLAEQVGRLAVGQTRAPGTSVRLVPPDRWHLTVVFLGDVPEEHEPDAHTAVAAAAGRWAGPDPTDGRRAGRADQRRADQRRADQRRADDRRGDDRRGNKRRADGRHRPDREPPRLWIGGGGRFGRGSATTLWTGLRGDTVALRDLASDVRRELRRAKLPFDAKALRPHITLARPGDRLAQPELDADLAALDAYAGPTWTADTVELVRSHLGPQVRYDRLATFPLTAAAGTS